MADNLQNAIYRIGQLESALKSCVDEIALIERRNTDRDHERQALERKQLLWGITFLGGACGFVIENHERIDNDTDNRTRPVLHSVLCGGRPGLGGLGGMARLGA